LPHLAPDDPQPVLEQVDPGDADSLDALTQLLPGGAYTTLRTFHSKQVLHLEDHFQRLESTAAMVEKPLYLHRSRARQAIQAALRQAQQRHYTPDCGAPSGEQDFRIRITLDLQDQPGDFYLALQPLTTPAHEAYQQGVPVVTFRMQRWLPKAKLTRFIQRSGELRRAMPPGVNETLMLDEQGHFLEGLSSNFFAVLEGEIWTAEEGVLSGITRSLVLEGIRRLGLPLRLQPANLADLPRIQEAFITSSSRAVLPVCRIDDHPLPSAPGPLTRRLMDEYARAVDASLEEIL
jgi:branched-chain amino acid aminotransferase